MGVKTKTFGMPPFLPNKALTRFGVGLVGKKGGLEWHHVRYSMNVDVASCFLYWRCSRTSSETLCLEVGSHPQPGTVKTVARDELLRSVDKKLVKHMRSSFGRCLFDTLFCSEVDFLLQRRYSASLEQRNQTTWLLDVLSLGVETSQWGILFEQGQSLISKDCIVTYTVLHHIPKCACTVVFRCLTYVCSRRCREL